MNLSAQELIIISAALIAAAGNCYFFVAAALDGHRGAVQTAVAAFFILSLVAAVFFWRVA
jgi:membrane-bound metal-dependent hydrolase YbcI (DUF457 family)